MTLAGNLDMTVLTEGERRIVEAYDALADAVKTCGVPIVGVVLISTPGMVVRFPMGCGCEECQALILGECETALTLLSEPARVH